MRLATGTPPGRGRFREAVRARRSHPSAGAYRDQLAAGRAHHPAGVVDAIGRIHEAVEALEFNPNEPLLLQSLLWSLPTS